MNLEQIRSAVTKVFDSHTKKSQTALKTEPYTFIAYSNYGISSLAP